MLYHDALVTGQAPHAPLAPTSCSVTFVDNREKIKQWISEQGATVDVS